MACKTLIRAPSNRGCARSATGEHHLCCAPSPQHREHSSTRVGCTELWQTPFAIQRGLLSANTNTPPMRGLHISVLPPGTSWIHSTHTPPGRGQLNPPQHNQVGCEDAWLLQSRRERGLLLQLPGFCPPHTCIQPTVGIYGRIRWQVASCCHTTCGWLTMHTNQCRCWRTLPPHLSQH